MCKIALAAAILLTCGLAAAQDQDFSKVEIQLTRVAGKAPAATLALPSARTGSS